MCCASLAGRAANACGELVMLILDVANILHVLTRGRVPGDGDMLELVGWLGNSRYGKQEVTLVCDGNPMRASGLRDRVVSALAAAGNTRQLLFSGPDQQADDVVEGLLEHSTAPGGVVVVSSDRRLRDAAKRMGAKSLRSEEFAEQLRDDARRRAFAGEANRDVGHISAVAWAAYFGIDLATGRAAGPATKQNVSLGSNRVNPTKRGNETTHNASSVVRTADDSTGDRVDCQTASLDALHDHLHATLHDNVRELEDVDASQLDMELWLKQFPVESSDKQQYAKPARERARRGRSRDGRA